MANKLLIILLQKNRTYLRLLATLVLLFCCNIIVAQKQGNVWCFGSHAGVDFNTSPPTLFTSSIDTYEGCASIADKITGQLLFYTDGTYVWNKNHALMPSPINGTLGGNTSSTQSAIIVPDPTNANKYYIFTCDAVAGVKGIQWTKVDMLLNGGLGDIITMPVQLITPISEKLTAARNAYGTGFWVVAHEWNANNFYAYPITSSGVGTPVISAVGLIHNGFNTNSLGYMKISPDGRTLALVIYNSSQLEIFDFNNSTGIISNPITDSSFFASSSFGLYGLSFSPNSKLLYISRHNTSQIFQYNLNAGSSAAVLASKTLIGSSSSEAIQLAPDGKIYVAKYLSNTLDVINSPNNLGVGCNFSTNAITLSAASQCQIGLPDIVENFFYPQDTTIKICSGQSISIGGHSYNTSGIYYETLINYLGGDSINTINLIVFQKDTIRLNASICSNQTYHLPNGNIVNTSGTYPVTLTNYLGCDSNITIHLTVNLISYSSINSSICPNQNYTLPNGSIVNKAGTYLDTLTNYLGCDSIITTHLSVMQISNSSINKTICRNQFYFFNGRNLNVAGTYLDTLTNAVGCDSLITLNLFINNISSNILTPSICKEGSFSIGIHQYSIAGIYLDTLQNAVGCDSFITTNLSIIAAKAHLVAVPDTFVNTGDNVNLVTHFLNQTDSILVWSPSNELTIINKTSAIAKPINMSSWYFVTTINKDGCLAKDSILILLLELNLPNAFTPNGDGENDIFIPRGNAVNSITEFSIFNRWGEKVFTSTDHNYGWDGKYKSVPQEMGTYVYVLKAELKNGVHKTLQGNFHLIR